MPEITAKDVMNLRNRTGLPMMDCKQALAESGGDVEAAEDILRKKLKGKMESRTARAAGEGRIAIATDTKSGIAAMVEIRAETDFTARNQAFVAAAAKIADIVLRSPGSGSIPVNDAATRIIDDLRASTGENISYARGHKISGETGTTAYGAYVHHDGRIGVLVQAEGSIADDTLRQICMHITAADPVPQGVSREDIPAALVERERRFRLEQAMESGKPREIAEKMVEGGMRKFYEEISLLDQKFVVDPTKTVRDVVGAKATINAFYRWQVGEQA